MNSCVCAVITTYQPQSSLNLKLIEMASQFEFLVVVDDTGLDNYENKLMSQQGKMLVIHNASNIGISASLNKGVLEAIKLGFKWIITLDDDTQLAEDYVKTIQDFLDKSRMEKVGLVSCSRGATVGLVGHGGYKIKRTLITSGCFFSSELFNLIGGFNEKLFIDMVDFDFSIKVRKKGLKLVELNKIGMQHRVGNSQELKFLGMHITVFHHSPFRLYYQARNVFYFFKSYWNFDFILASYILLDILRLPVKALFFEKQKVARLKYISLGIYHGLIGRYGKIPD